MKKIKLLAACILLSLAASSQLIGITGGMKQLKVKKGDIYFFYLDESPVPDYIDTRITLKGKKFVPCATLDYQSGLTKNKPYWLIRATGYSGEILGVDAGLGVGYSLPLGKKGKASIDPEISALFGYNKINLGTLKVQASGSVYIQVNNTQFGNYEDVDIALRNIYYGIKPAINFSFNIGKNTWLRIFTGYHFDTGKTEIVFTGRNNANEEVKDFENLKDQNLYFEVNGASYKKAPFRAGGVEARLGIFFDL